MGVCCCGSSGEPSDRQSCSDIGCDYYEDPNTSCIGAAACGVLTALAEFLATEYENDPIVLLAAGGTYTTLLDLGDVVLKRSSLGQEVLDRYFQFAAPAVAMIRADEDLFREALRVFLMYASFGRAILRAHYGKTPDEIGDRRYTRELHEKGVAVLERVGEVTKISQFDEVIEFAKREGDRFIGMSAWDVLQELDLDGSRGPSAT
jgi:hypothetical protein